MKESISGESCSASSTTLSRFPYYIAPPPTKTVRNFGRRRIKGKSARAPSSVKLLNRKSKVSSSRQGSNACAILSTSAGVKRESCRKPCTSNFCSFGYWAIDSKLPCYCTLRSRTSDCTKKVFNAFGLVAPCNKKTRFTYSNQRNNRLHPAKTKQGWRIRFNARPVHPILVDSRPSNASRIA